MKNIVITGSTHGLGFAMAREFLRAGCHVSLSGRHESPPASVSDDLADFSGMYIYVRCNVQKKDDLERLWRVSQENWGQINIWINNAGQNTPHIFSWETNASDTAKVIHTNLLGMIYGSQVAAVGMLQQGNGAIYSMEGLGSNNMIQPKTILYGTTKHALTYFMKALAKELEGSPVIAGRLSPGMVLTDFITKAPDGTDSDVLTDPNFIKVFNILADRPETVAEFFVPHMLRNKKNDAHIVWLTRRKAAWRFITARSRTGRLIRGGNSK